jgi:putative SOS response-associated peptidase YedK
MCGRYAITSPPEAVQRIFGVPERPNWPARYNVAPTQDVPVVRLGDDGGRHLVHLRWGLVPFWADEPGIGARMINARADSAPTKPAFRAAFARRRCLVVADAFYEWQKPEQTGGRKQPYCITRADGEPFGFAGLWERWRPPDGGEPLESCTILTTDANAVLQPIHERMPVMLDPAVFAQWLDPEASRDDLTALLRPAPDDSVRAFRISTRVNKVAHDDPEVMAPLDAPSSGESDTGQGRLL